MDSSTPLAHLLRPQTLTDFIGQSHLTGRGKPLRAALESHQIFSLLFWGPPGVGKTTLARMLARNAEREFIDLSAVSASKQDVRDVVEHARSQPLLAAPVLFLDEIHRFNKAQQDFLLPYVEDGTIILIGATTENPSFEVIGALLSRCRVFTLNPLSYQELELLLARAIKHLAPLSTKKIKLSATTTAWIINYAYGDGRKLLTLLDHTWQLYQALDLDSLKAALQSNTVQYDKKGEEHYNTISAFIKSMRASNVDAALYYLARMVAAGEDPQFIARRMVIFASEDVGLGQPTALVVANAVFAAVGNIGYPEAQINLAHGVAYLAQAKKNRSAYDAYFAALADVQKLGNLPIPLNLRNAPTKLMQELGYGEGYAMYPNSKKILLPKELIHKKYYQP